MNHRLTTLLTLLLFLQIAPVFGAPDNIAALSSDPQWLALLQYQRSDWDGALRSEVDSDDFFLSDRGKTDPEEEMSVNIRVLEQRPQLQCRFPARAQWLHSQGLIDTLAIDESHCPKLNQWLQKFEPEHISLIFPAAYLNSPSSMFGHLFLRVDQKNQRDENRLLAQTINFAANVNHDDPELIYAYRGLFGGYPGVISVMPCLLYTSPSPRDRG